jgi:hypothetical protein
MVDDGQLYFGGVGVDGGFEFGLEFGAALHVLTIELNLRPNTSTSNKLTE